MQYGLKTHAVKHEPIALQLLEQTLKLGSQLRFTRLLERIVTETVRCTFSQATDDCLLFVFSWLVSRGVNCSRTAGRIEMPLGKNFRRPQIFSPEISGPKVVLLCKVSFYQAVRGPLSGPGPWRFSLTIRPWLLKNTAHKANGSMCLMPQSVTMFYGSTFSSRQSTFSVMYFEL